MTFRFCIIYFTLQMGVLLCTDDVLKATSKTTITSAVIQQRLLNTWHAVAFYRRNGGNHQSVQQRPVGALTIGKISFTKMNTICRMGAKLYPIYFSGTIIIHDQNTVRSLKSIPTRLFYFRTTEPFKQTIP